MVAKELNEKHPCRKCGVCKTNLSKINTYSSIWNSSKNICKKCHYLQGQAWKKKNYDRWRKEENLQARKRYLERRIWVIDFLGHKCKKCGYDLCFNALEVHHLSGKEYWENKMFFRASKERLMKILKHCILLCSRCHAEEHCNNKFNCKHRRKINDCNTD